MYLLVLITALKRKSRDEFIRGMAVLSTLLLIASLSALAGRVSARSELRLVEHVAEIKVIISSNDVAQTRPPRLTQKVLEASPKIQVGSGVYVPVPMIELYMKASERYCPGLHWSYIGGVYEVESSHMLSKLPGVTSGVNWKGAAGPGQFLTKPTKGMKLSTWEAYGIDGNGDGIRNVYDPEDAVPGTANALCKVPAGRTVWTKDRVKEAIWWYNHSDIYVKEVLHRADRLKFTYNRLLNEN